VLYLDTSCLLKLFFVEPETTRTAAIVAREDRVIVSTLAMLEVLVQIHARVEGGLLTQAASRRLVARIDAVLQSQPYDRVDCTPTLTAIAERQVRARASVHCRTMDRLHLATMEGLGVGRLLTNDDPQARAARALGFEVLLPR